MNMYNLGVRRTGNRLKKITSIEKITVDGNLAYRFYSSYDECSYIYKKYSLRDALRTYERDTIWQGYAEIEYFTLNAEIVEEFKKIMPF